jgi:hypothetical protein
MARHFKMATAAVDQWNQCFFNPWFRVEIDREYYLAVLYPLGNFFRQNSVLTSSVRHNNIDFVHGFQSTSLGIADATITENTNANAVDIIFYPD